MKHARPDYERFQDPAGIIPRDEPVLLLRGQDIAAPDTPDFWADRAADAGASEDIVQVVREHAERMREWQQTVARKVPDLPAKGS